jgi:TMEM175 potassium channel family protein
MTSETSRIEAFSDGVFSIAATLLVLELKAPPPNMPFWNGLAAQWPGFASFLLSFLFIGIMWINHHRLFTHVRRADDVLLAANLLLLLGVVWIPYPTLVMAQALTSGRVREAAILYNGSYLVIALLYNLQLYACIHRGLVDREYAAMRQMAHTYSLGPGLYAVCFAVSWWNVPVSLALNGALALFFLLSPELRVRRA